MTSERSADKLDEIGLTACVKIGRKFRVTFEAKVGIFLIGRCSDAGQPCAVPRCSAKIRCECAQQCTVASEANDDVALTNELPVIVGKFGTREYADNDTAQRRVAP